MDIRRTALTGTVALVSLVVSGCANHWQRPVEADGSYCYVFGKKRATTCTAQPVPSAVADLEVKRFEPDPKALTVIVVRHRWADARGRIPVAVDGGPPVSTVPESFVRLRLAPGRHTLAAAWDGQTVAQTVEGRAGDVQMIELVGSQWWSNRSYRWDASDADDTRQRAMKSRLVADLAIR